MNESKQVIFNAMVERFKSTIAEGRGVPFEQTGVSLPASAFEGYADAIDAVLRASAGVAPALVAAIIERCAKIADPWPGYWIDHSSTEAECAVVAVRTEIAAKIRAMAVSSTHAAPRMEKEATFGEDGYNPAYDEGITYAIRMLADLTGSKDWQMKDGSEDHESDVRDTIMDVLKCAGLYDDETGTFATRQQPGGAS
jgi:hypothetical protein